MQSFNHPKHSRYADLVEFDDDRPHASNILFPCANEYSSDYDSKAVDISGEYENLYGYVNRCYCGLMFALMAFSIIMYLIMDQNTKQATCKQRRIALCWFFCRYLKMLRS